MSPKAKIEVNISLMQGYLENYQAELITAEKDGRILLAIKAKQNIRSVKSTIRSLQRTLQSS